MVGEDWWSGARGGRRARRGPIAIQTRRGCPLLRVFKTAGPPRTWLTHADLVLVGVTIARDVAEVRVVRTRGPTRLGFDAARPGVRSTLETVPSEETTLTEAGAGVVALKKVP